MRKTINFSIAGLGIIFYSPFAVMGILEDEDYLKSSYTKPDDVAAYVMRCDISTFCTGSGGDYEIIVYDGELESRTLDASRFRIRLGIEVRDGEICFRDLYDLMQWSKDCPAEQRISLKNGFYRITAYTSPPPSGIIGDHQSIYLHFEKTLNKPELYWPGIPHLCE